MDDVFEGGYAIGTVRDAQGRELHKHINRTMMRVDLPSPLAPGQPGFRRANLNDCSRSATAT